MDLSKYEFEPFCQSDEFALLRGVRMRTPAPDPPSVIVSIPTSEHPRLDCLNMMDREFALRSNLESWWAVTPIAMAKLHRKKALVLQDVDAEPLESVFSRLRGDRRFVDMGLCLKLAVSIAASVGEMHRKRLVHRHLKPTHILVNLREERAWLTGFGITSQLRRERVFPSPPEIIPGSLAYIAPEQTGRMNRSIDARCDLYALGVILYEMTTGTLPYDANDPLEWVHCHVVRQAVPPKERTPQVPEAISSIIMRLLAKNPEDRYQTAAGLEYDLRVCLDKFTQGQHLGDLVLGERDRSYHLLIPEKLYGRDHDIEKLLGAFGRVARDGTSELLLISGYSGIGKSAIVSELQKALIPPRSLYASGKFEQYKRDVPYFTLAHAFQELFPTFLMKDDAELAIWREDLRQALEIDGNLLLEIMPSLRPLIGELLPVNDPPPLDLQRRFRAVFRRFLNVFARSEHPLVMFLDDLQWADQATLELLEYVSADPEIRHVLWIGAYRDNEIGPTDPLMRLIRKTKEANVKVCEIALAPLSREDTGQFISDTLGGDSLGLETLIDLLYRKTAGNPFFLTQFLSALEEDELFFFDEHLSTWRWNIAEIEAMDYTENVVDLMTQRLARLSPHIQSLLQLFACAGRSVSLQRLEMIREAPTEELQQDVEAALQSGLIVFFEEKYHFLHDRIQEAAYKLLPEPQRAAVHLRIGRLLAQQLHSSQNDDAIFDVVSQLNRGRALISSSAERRRLAELNLIASKRAKISAAFSSALQYCTVGLSSIPKNGWRRWPALVFALELNRAECEFLTGDLSTAEERLLFLSARATSTIEHGQVACLRIDLSTTLGKTEVAIEIGLDFLDRFDRSWPRAPTEAEVRWEYERAWTSIIGRSIEELVDLPLMSDADTLAKMDVLTKVATPALLANDKLHSLLICRIVNLSLEYGNTHSSCHAYVHLGALAGRRFGQYKAGYTFGCLGYELIERRGLQRFKARTFLSFACLVMPWGRHLRAAREMFRKAFANASKLGDITFAGYTSHNLISHMLTSGDSLASIRDELVAFLDFARQARFGLVTDILETQNALVTMLQGESPRFGCLDSASFIESEFEDHISGDPSLAIAACWYWVRKLQARFFAGDYSEAIEAYGNAHPLLSSLPTFLETSDAYFYSALSHAGSYDGASPIDRVNHLDALAAHHAKIAEWAEYCPENFAGRATLLAAEMARVHGREFEAQRLYETAIRLSQENDFIQDEGLANELAARFCFSNGLETVARAHLENARYCYSLWGAGGKIRHLDQKYHHAKIGFGPVRSTTVIGEFGQQLDLATVLKLSESILGEMDAEKVVETVIHTAVEHAGAERALLVLCRGSENRTVAKAAVESDVINVQLLDEPVSASVIAHGVLSYVIHTRESVAVDDAAKPNAFSSDPYFKLYSIRSVLCIPLVNQANLVGVLYLENNQASKVFAPAGLALTKVIASQAAISLENARLYRDLEKRETRFRRLVDANIIGIFLFEFEGTIFEANDALLSLLGYSRAEFVAHGLRWTELVPEDLRYLDGQLFSELEKHGILQPFESEYLRKDGSRVPVLIGVATFEDNPNQGVAYALDLTERQKSQVLLNHARAELAHVSRVNALNALTASITHEISQPISGIIMNATSGLRMLSSEPPNLVGAHETARRTLRDGIRAKDVIDRLRAMFEKRDFTPERMDLNDAVREIIMLSMGDLKRSIVHLRTELSQDLPAIEGDRVQLQQVILNIVRNGADAMLGIDNRPRQMLVRTFVDDSGEVVFAVRDSGVGIPREKLNTLFDAFYTTKIDGLGIGLFISRSIIERHGGRIWGETNHPEVGATFAFALPTISP